MSTNDLNEPLYKRILSYLLVLIKYIRKYLFGIFSFVISIVKTVLFQFIKINRFFVFRLMWQRGKFGRPLGHLGIVIVTLMILFFSSFSKSSNVLSDTTLAAILSSSEKNELNNDYMIHLAQMSTELPSGRTPDEIKTYSVKGGDTLYQIAELYNITVDTILAVNNISLNDTLHPGQELKILPLSGLEHEVQTGDNLESIATKYKLDTPQPIVEVNWLEKPYTLIAGQKLIIPGGIMPEPPKPVYSPPVYAAIPTVQPVAPIAGSGQFLWPTPGYMSRGYGWFYGIFHGAVDVANNSCGNPIYAADSGYVEASGWKAGGWGIAVWLDHRNGYKSKYAHMSSTVVSTGTNVSRGQLIGYSGETGLAYGCHLHFVIERNGIAINPQTVL